MALFEHSLLVLSVVQLVVGSPYHPPTCYTKVLNMARALTQQAAELKRDPETVSHHETLSLIRSLTVPLMRTYISLVEGLRERRCSYTREVRKLGGNVRQLYHIMSQRCHGVRQWI
uniref:Uncharacterized protein n=1 Tax=Myripristis murdjan TaxID=586833 RepID=A0A667WXC2_9TELE